MCQIDFSVAVPLRLGIASREPLFLRWGLYHTPASAVLQSISGAFFSLVCTLVVDPARWLDRVLHCMSNVLSYWLLQVACYGSVAAICQ